MKNTTIEQMGLIIKLGAAIESGNRKFASRRLGSERMKQSRIDTMRAAVKDGSGLLDAEILGALEEIEYAYHNVDVLLIATDLANLTIGRLNGLLDEVAGTQSQGAVAGTPFADLFSGGLTWPTIDPGIVGAGPLEDDDETPCDCGGCYPTDKEDDDS
ncbi:MAG: hypothetical protein WC822_01335 [Candidatus Paceibacterota bacterium]|jgi:hypothetical protein